MNLKESDSHVQISVYNSNEFTELFQPTKTPELITPEESAHDEKDQKYTTHTVFTQHAKISRHPTEFLY